MGMNRIKVVHITSSLKIGGAERMLSQLVKATEVEHVVFYFHHGPFVKVLQDTGIKTVHITGWLYRYDLFFFIRLCKALYAERPAVIHALLWAANITARLSGYLLRIPVITAYHSHVDQDNAFRRLLDRLTIGLSYKHIAVSKQVAQSVCRNSAKDLSTVIEIIPNGIEVRTDVACLSELDIKLPPDAFVIGAVGRFVPLKRFDILLEAMAQIALQRRSLYVILVGVGLQEQSLRDRAQTLGIGDRVIFIVGRDAYPYYSLFNCFVQPSEKEGISMALLEAMSLKVPCIVMGDAYMHPVITHNRDGLVCLPGDKAMLAAYIALMCAHECEVKGLADRGYQKICQTFSLSVMIDKYANIFIGASAKSAE
jgi:glycosyltransferase involved in cell wall biosynthesis